MIEIERLCFAEPWPESSFLDELANERAAYFVALSPEDGAVVGYCGYWRVAGEAHIMNLAVSPAAQRKGIGRRLLGLLMRDAAEHGIATAFLEAREDNAAALALYGQFGFVRCGLRVNYYSKEQKDAIVMQADLRSVQKQLDPYRA
jgi:ribosomal-protein-alanine N-acetyltransferase